MFSQDLNYAIRSLRRTPIFTAAVLITTALGIGANTAMFSVIHGVLLRPLTYPEPDRVVQISEGATAVRFREFTSRAQSYSELGAVAGGLEEMSLSGNGAPEVLEGARVSANFLDVLRVSPLRGRSFFPEEDKPGAPGVAMISARLWQRRFGGDPMIVGKTVALAGAPHIIVAVLPDGFQFPFSRLDVWVTQPWQWSVISAEGRENSPFLIMFGRLKPSVTLPGATAELRVLRAQYAAAHPTMMDAKPESPEQVQPWKEFVVSDVRSELWMLFGAVGLVLLIVCANVGGLLLARAAARQHEFAVRAAIGAGRHRIVGQLLVEAMLLACVGGGLGLASAGFAMRAIRSLTFVNLPRAGEIHLNGMVVGFVLLLSVATGILFGLVPAMATSKQANLSAILQGSGESNNAVHMRRWLYLGPHGVLVVGQVALSLMLLIGASLLIESMACLYRVDPGFQTGKLLTMKIALPEARYNTDHKRAQFYGDIAQRVESLPGVRGAAITMTLPMTDTWFGTGVQVTGRPPLKSNELPIAIAQKVTPGYFRTMQIPLKQGRDFSATDNLRSPRVVIISEKLARLFWPKYPNVQSPIGQHILIGEDPHPNEVVGIAADIRQSGRDEELFPEYYLPCLQRPAESAALVVRTMGDPLSFTDAVRNQVLQIDHEQPVSDVITMDALVDNSEGQLRLMMRLLGTFAGAATMLAMVGLYGVIACSVLQRTREIGIRRALGAQRMHIVSHIVGQGLGLVAVGVGLGICGAFAGTRLLSSFLFHVSAADPITFLAISMLFVTVAIGASYIPARRATKVDPMAAIRQN